MGLFGGGQGKEGIRYRKEMDKCKIRVRVRYKCKLGKGGNHSFASLQDRKRRRRLACGSPASHVLAAGMDCVVPCRFDTNSPTQQSTNNCQLYKCNNSGEGASVLSHFQPMSIRARKVTKFNHHAQITVPESANFIPIAPRFLYSRALTLFRH